MLSDIVRMKVAGILFRHFSVLLSSLVRSASLKLEMTDRDKAASERTPEVM